MQYEIWTNISARPEKFLNGYAPGDNMVMTWVGDVSGIARSRDTLEYLFWRFNSDDRPNRTTGHSLSIGDVVVLDGIAHAVAFAGFAQLAEFRPPITEGR
jgi:hypothetical protein